MGREYGDPAGDREAAYRGFRDKLRRAYMANREAPQEDVERLLARGEYVKKGLCRGAWHLYLTLELETLYWLRRYRSLRRAYAK